jgi:hypothetical protein
VVQTGSGVHTSEADHSPPASAEVKKIWVYTSTPPYANMAQYLIATLSLPYYIVINEKYYLIFDQFLQIQTTTHNEYDVSYDINI